MTIQTVIWRDPAEVSPGRYFGFFPHRTKVRITYHCEMLTKVGKKWVTRLGRMPLYVCDENYAQWYGTTHFPPLPPLPEEFWTSPRFEHEHYPKKG